MHSTVSDHYRLLGVAAKYDFGQIFALAGVEFVGAYSQSLADPTGAEIKNQKPLGFVIQSGYKLTPNISADIRVSLVSYSEDSVGGVVNDVSGNKRSQMDFAIGVS